MPPKEKLLAGIFLGSLSLAFVIGGINLSTLMTVLTKFTDTLGWLAVIIALVLGSFVSAVLWCACRHSVIRTELNDLPSPPKEAAAAKKPRHPL